MNISQTDTAAKATADAQKSTSTAVSAALDGSPPRTDKTGAASGNDESRAPEEEAQSEVPGDPRPPHQTQPPTKDQY